MSGLGRDDWRELNALAARLERIGKPMAVALERSAKASEDLLAIAEKEQMSFEVEPGPPVCPSCGTLNPTVRTQERADSGPLAEVAFEFETECCHSRLYAIPDGWIMTTNRSEAIEMIRERAAVASGSRNSHIDA
jgi:hypothetical protein